MKKTLGRFLTIIIVITVLLGSTLNKAYATPTGAATTAIASWTGITLAVATAAYLAWVSRPANQPVDWGPRGPGGYYLGLYTGMSFIPTMDWNYQNPDIQFGAQTPYPTTARNIGLGSSPVIGMKLGYYFYKLPYLGLEGDFFYSKPSAKDQTVKISPPFPPNNRIPGNQALFPGQDINQWTLAVHIMARYGFIKDDEVPFGRIQPYVGIGPGFTVLYGHDDSAKNFGIDGLVGLRYMLRKNLSVFTEFKINHQFAVELEHQKLKQLPPGFHEQRAMASFDFTMLTWAVGMCVHFW
jgi:Outer membrane protein beta-barrel domain